MKRRGFLQALLGLVAAPALAKLPIPAPEPEAVFHGAGAIGADFEIGRIDSFRFILSDQRFGTPMVASAYVRNAQAALNRREWMRISKLIPAGEEVAIDIPCNTDQAEAWGAMVESARQPYFAMPLNMAEDLVRCVQYHRRPLPDHSPPPRRDRPAYRQILGNRWER